MNDSKNSVFKHKKKLYKRKYIKIRAYRDYIDGRKQNFMKMVSHRERAWQK